MGNICSFPGINNQDISIKEEKIFEENIINSVNKNKSNNINQYIQAID